MIGAPDRFVDERGRRSWRVLRGVVVLALASTAEAQTTYLCPPAPTGVPGLSGGPRFADSPLPDSFAAQLDDPRWTGAWREDFSDASSTEASARILNDGSNLFLSLQAVIDPDGAQVGSDAVYFGFSKDGTTGIFVKVVMDAAPPAGGFVNDATSISAASSWKTTNGGTSGWPKQGPQTWTGPTTVHIWTGAGTGNHASWAVNAKLSLATLGTALGLGGALSGPFYMWYQINIETPSTTAAYSWPAGSTVEFDSTTTDCTPANPCAILPIVGYWGIVNPPDVSNCPTGASIDATSIGATPVAAGVPGTTAYFGAGAPANSFVAELTNTDSLNPLTQNSVQARFRIADWTSAVGVGGSWTDLATTGTPVGPVDGSDGVRASEVVLACINPPFSPSSTNCYQPPLGAPASQGMLIELSQANHAGMRFVHDSAWMSMTFVNPANGVGGSGGGAGGGGRAGQGGNGGGQAGQGGGGAGSGTGGGGAGSGGQAGQSGTAGAAGTSTSNAGAGGSGGGGPGGQRATGGASGGSAGIAGSAGPGSGGQGGQPAASCGGGCSGQLGGGGPGWPGLAPLMFVFGVRRRRRRP